MKQDIKNYTLKKFEGFLKENNLPSYCGSQIFSWLYQKRVEEFDQMSNLAKKTRQILAKNFFLSKIELKKREVSKDGTEKLLFALADNNFVEAALIPEGRRLTFCVSSQVGCKFGCKFCFSGKGGFKRNLSCAEIINQYLAVVDLAGASKITNIVFMGVGEPLDNFINTIKAIRLLINPKGFGFSKRRISISTCGLTREIERLAKLDLGIKLSVSLHAADDITRSKIMPINKRYPLRVLFNSLNRFQQNQKQEITFEYVLIAGLNTARGHALKLARLLRGIKCKVNLIPYNECGADLRPPTEKEVFSFSEELKKQGVFFTVRKPKGRDIKAACGQLSRGTLPVSFR
ncbi:MAG: 23S rRNA (adenine(2503)-C(2))-methyltransferase RlmN [Candidatus Omnitrophica bacterium]|nr:23S rRNA (adenine(2503)-C(2))-methyltransferase RlmN [Candidatus Omnitrophota bacterium]